MDKLHMMVANTQDQDAMMCFGASMDINTGDCPELNLMVQRTEQRTKTTAPPARQDADDKLILCSLSRTKTSAALATMSADRRLADQFKAIDAQQAAHPGMTRGDALLAANCDNPSLFADNEEELASELELRKRAEVTAATAQSAILKYAAANNVEYGTAFAAVAQTNPELFTMEND